MIHSGSIIASGLSQGKSTTMGFDTTGVTINAYQVKRGNQLCKAANTADVCRLEQADFMSLPYADESFDGVYAIEATCHAPQRQGVYSEIFRVLKPGAIFACYEWCLTDLYDAKSADHRRIKKWIEEGDGLPDMAHTHEVDEALRDVGFELLESRDCALDACVGPSGRALTFVNRLSQRTFCLSPEKRSHESNPPAAVTRCTRGTSRSRHNTTRCLSASSSRRRVGGSLRPCSA